MKNVLVTGAEGQRGSSLKKIAGNFPQYNFIYNVKTKTIQKQIVKNQKQRKKENNG